MKKTFTGLLVIAAGTDIFFFVRQQTKPVIEDPTGFLAGKDDY
jgi:hypothetical protein